MPEEEQCPRCAMLEMPESKRGCTEKGLEDDGPEQLSGPADCVSALSSKWHSVIAAHCI